MSAVNRIPDPSEDDGGHCLHCDNYTGESKRCHACDCYACENCDEEHDATAEHQRRTS